MKLFIDSADINEIKKSYEFGIIDGITTNPSLIKKASKKYKENMEEYIKNIFLISKNNPVSLEIVSLSEKQMIYEAEKLYSKFKNFGNVIIKVPISTSSDNKNNFDAIKTIKQLSKKGIPTNVTLIMSPEQALLAAKSGATYISPFVGRIDDYLKKIHPNLKIDKKSYYSLKGRKYKNKIIHDNGIFSGVHLVEEIIKIFSNYNFKTKIIAASIRNQRQIRELALVGTDIITIPFDLLNEIIIHNKTIEGVKKFSEDVIESYKSLFD